MNYPDMKRIRQSLSEKECWDLLSKNGEGVLSLVSPEGYPYGVPLNYFCENGAIYFHCAKKGFKLDCIRHCSRVSFCVIDQAAVLPEIYETAYRSVIAFGKATVLDSLSEILPAIRKLGRRFNPTDDPHHLEEVIERNLSALCMIRMDVQYISGKQSVAFIDGSLPPQNS